MLERNCDEKKTVDAMDKPLRGLEKFIGNHMFPCFSYHSQGSFLGQVHKHPSNLPSNLQPPKNNYQSIRYFILLPDNMYARCGCYDPTWTKYVIIW